MSTEITKPALAPKPQGLGPYSPVTHPKYSSSLLSTAGLIHQSNSMSRGPKPPIAPKPVLSPASERRSIEDTNNSLNKCTNGEVTHSMEKIYDTDQYSPECSETLDMTYEDYMTVPDSQLTDEESNDLECEKNSCFDANNETWGSSLEGEGHIDHCKSCSPTSPEEEDSGHIESVQSRFVESAESTELEDSDNTDALSLRSSSTAEADSLLPHSESETQFKNDLGDMEDFLPLDSIESGTKNEEEVMADENVILTEIHVENLTGPDDKNLEECKCCENCLEDISFNDSPGQSFDESALDLVGISVDVESPEESLVPNSLPCDEVTEAEQDLAAKDLGHTIDISGDYTCNDEVEKEEHDALADFNNDGEDNIDNEITEVIDVVETIESDSAMGESTNELKVIDDDNMDESCQIIPFESEGNEDLAEPSDGTLGIENSLCENLISEPFAEPESEDFKDLSEEGLCDKAQETNNTEGSPEVTDTAADGEQENIIEEDPPGTTQGDAIEEDGADAADMSPEAQESTHMSPDCQENADMSLDIQESTNMSPEVQIDTDMSPEDQESQVKEVTMDTEGNVPMAEAIPVPEEEDDSNPYVLEDSVQSRNRKLFHPEESELTKTEEEALRSRMMEEYNFEGDNHLLGFDRKNLVTRTRSYSGKIHGNVPETVPEETGAEADTQPSSEESAGNMTHENVETKQADLGRALPRKPSRFILYPRSYSVEGRENTVSLYLESDVTNFTSPYVIASSGSFSQRNHHSSSGMSTPTSVVDIPPPFELASITKKPITKSSPSLLIENECSEKSFKKKKSSFKKFLTLKFKKKTENKVHVDVNVSSSRSSSEASYHGASRLVDMDRRSLSNSPQFHSRSGVHGFPDSPSAMLFYKDMKRKGASKAFNRSVARVESFEDRSRPPFMPLPLTKPRSISFPNADTSDYENIPAMSSDYENIQIPPPRPSRAGTFTEFFEDPSRALSSANENDGYVDMSSFNTFEVKQQASDQETESAYTEPYKVCPINLSHSEDVTSDEEQKSSEDEGQSLGESGALQKKDGPVRALSIVQDLVTSEKVYVETLRRLHTEFHMAVLKALGHEEEDEEEELRLRHGLSELQDIYLLHEEILGELEQRIPHWEESQKIADVFLSRQSGFQHHTAFIVAFDKTMAALDDCSLKSPQISLAVREFERNLHRGQVKHELVKVVQRVFQYHMILTDYLNNLCPDWMEYEDTQAALLIVSEVADRANDGVRQGENLQKLVQIDYSVRGQRSLLQPGREFVKEGTLMKVSGKNRHPRHLFLMSDVLLYTYPQKDGKYKLKNTLSIPGMRVSRPIVEEAQNILKIECMECCLMLSASSCSERDDWFSCISRTVQEYYKAPTVSVYHNSVEIRERLGLCLGERPPSVAFVSHAMMCMNCGSDFSLTLRRHHCHACGKIVCRSCSRNKYPLKYLRDRPSKVCNGCYAELRKREATTLNMNSSPTPRSAISAFSSMFHNIHPASFRKHKKIPSALMEAAASGENSSISGYLHRCKKGKKYWKKRWFVIKGKVLYTYTACEDKVATESLPLLGFHIVPDKWDETPKLGTVFQLYHKQTLFYSFKAGDTNAAIRWVEAIKAASIL
ncbi:FYVE, RhoGEF and PH domain-containing protein 5 [Discoglossus pictus]